MRVFGTTVNDFRQIQKANFGGNLPVIFVHLGKGLSGCKDLYFPFYWFVTISAGTLAKLKKKGGFPWADG